LDVDDNGIINMLDLYYVALTYGATGTPLTKAGLLYDSGWLNITDKCGQYFAVTHSLNSLDVTVDITGRTTSGGGVHQRYLGGTDFVAGWNKTYGGTDQEIPYCLVPTSDGGYAMAGPTWSFGAGSWDFWLVKTDSSGNVQWNKTYGGSGSEYGPCTMIATSDGGYAMVSNTQSFGNSSYGNDDCWLVKTDANGNAQWNKTYGGTGGDEGGCIFQTSDGGYIIGGSTYSFGAGDQDAWLIKTDSSGNMQWNRTYGGTGTDDWAFSAVPANDGGYTLYGTTTSFGAGYRDLWLVKTDANGNMEWNKTYGGTDHDNGHVLKQTTDGGYAIVGYTHSFGAGGYDCWLIKTDANGNMEWNKTYGGTGYDVGHYVVQTADGGYVLIAETSSFGKGSTDFWLIKTDAMGNALDGFKYGLAWVGSTLNTIELYRGTDDEYWNYVRVQIWARR
jgi:hypothetical protein